MKLSTDGTLAVGMEVISADITHAYVITKISSRGRLTLIRKDGTVFNASSDGWMPTGRLFDIEGLLEKM